MRILRHYDVVVVGGNPAGAAAAIAAARNGLSVAVLSKPRANAPPIGETVPPKIKLPLSQLGLWGEFQAAQHAEAPGTVVMWGDEKPYENDFVFNPYGPAWHLDRANFDAMLLKGARAAGAAIYDHPARDCRRNADGRWSVLVHGGAELSARWMVDATGRAAWLARRLGARRHRTDGLVGLVRFAPVACSDEPRTIIESRPEGWWYAAVLPDKRAVAAFFTDADLLPRRAQERAALWTRLLSETQLVPNIFPEQVTALPIHTTAAFSGRTLPCAGPGWLAVGDAGHCHDPLCGQGIYKALSSALRGAGAISAELAGKHCMDEFISTGDREFQQYRAGYSTHYRSDRRWLMNSFWQRRNISAVMS